MITAVVNGFILSAALALAIALLTRRGLNAATRYAVWCVALGGTALLPMLYTPSAETRRAIVAAPMEESGPAAGAGRSEHPALPPAVLRVDVNAGSWPQWIAIAWSLAALVLVARLVASCATLEQRKSSAADAPAELNARLAVWLSQCGCRRRVRLAISTEVGAPMAVGPLRPTILIPARLALELDANELEQIGLHEAAHLARWDDWALIIQRILEAALAFHPVARWIARRIDLEREIACDDLVVAATESPRAYAKCLTRVAALTAGWGGSPAASAAAEETSHLARRVELLLDRKRTSGTELLKARLCGTLSVLAALCAMGAKAPRLIAFPMAQASTVQLIAVTVTDPLGRFVAMLGKDNFTLVENGVRQDIRQFSADMPVSAGILLDAGEGIENMQTPIEAFLGAARAGDEFFLVQSDGRPALVQGFTSDSGRVLAAVKAIRPRGRVSLEEAIDVATREMQQAAHSRKALVVIAGGVSDQIRERLRRTNLAAYAVSAPELVRLGIRLRNQYVLGYVSTNTERDGKYRTVLVKAQARGLPPLTVMARDGYYAPAK